MATLGVIVAVIGTLMILSVLVAGIRGINAEFSSLERKERESREHRKLMFLLALEKARDGLKLIPNGNADELYLAQIKRAEKKIERARDLSDGLAFSIPSVNYRVQLDDFAVAVDELLEAIEIATMLIMMAAPDAERAATLKNVRGKAAAFAGVADKMPHALF
jgi:hypothetical protein